MGRLNLFIYQKKRIKRNTKKKYFLGQKVYKLIIRQLRLFNCIGDPKVVAAAYII